MEKCQGWALSGHVATYTNKNAVQNVFKIATAQIDRTLYLIKKNVKSLIESVKKNLESRRCRYSCRTELFY